MILTNFEKAGKIAPPSWLTANTCFLTLHGSKSYGCATETSDNDVYGICIPPKDYIFYPNTYLRGFGTQPPTFDQWQQQVEDYDFSVYNIVKYFQLAMNANPNIIDCLYTYRDCVLHSTHVGELIRNNRRLFLSKKAFFTFKNYAVSQISKMKAKNPQPGSKRAALVAAHGFDTKFSVHLVRLALELEQLLTDGEMDLKKHAKTYIDIRNGEWSEQEVYNWFSIKEVELDKLYRESKALPEKPNEELIKTLLLDCLESHYGSLSEMVTRVDKNEQALREIRKILGNL